MTPELSNPSKRARAAYISDSGQEQVKRLYCMALLIGLVQLAAGCWSAAPSRGFSSKDTSWDSTSADATPGIDKAAVSIVHFTVDGAERVRFVVWSDLLGLSGSGGTTPQGAFYAGRHGSAPGRQFAFQVEMKNDEPVAVNIGEASYPLDRGGLLLVSTATDPPQVEQIDIELTDFPTEKQDLIDLAKRDERIHGFFEQHAQ